MSGLSAACFGLGFAAPGAEGEAGLRAALADPTWTPDADWAPRLTCLAPRAARRVSPEIRLALAAAEQIAPHLPPEAGWVFASSTGEGETLNVILEALASPEMMIQPLRFQNAVHNAAAGQWTIAAGLQGPATSVAAYDETVGAGLLKALLQVALERRPVGLVLFDAPIPPPLHEKRPITLPLAASLALRPPGVDGPALAAELREAPPSAPASAFARRLAATRNPAAAALPLLEALLGPGGRVVLGLPGARNLAVKVAR